LSIPFLDREPRGIFATRAPSRPNPVGLSLVELVRLERNLIYVERLDMLNETPLLDVKPYVPEFEHTHHVRVGQFSHSSCLQVFGRPTRHAADRFAVLSGRLMPTLAGLLKKCKTHRPRKSFDGSFAQAKMRSGHTLGRQ
jgi:hypothetical protein